MTTYAIGDLQGCYEPLRALLDKVRFDAARDRLWFVGDLVNRGPQSLEVLRFVRDLGDRATVVLGNHDLHLLAMAAGYAVPRRGDTLDGILGAADRDELLIWLQHCPLAHFDEDLGVLMVHAGVAPQWSLIQTLARAAELEQVLRGEAAGKFFAAMYSEEGTLWRDDLTGPARWRTIADFLTRARFLDRSGRCDLSAKGPPGTQPAGHMPWFDHPDRRTVGQRIVFGHWSALGAPHRNDVLALDTGCLWGGCLSAVRLDPPHELFQIDCPGAGARPNRPVAG